MTDLTNPLPEVKRDRWGRYLIDGKPYTRATTVANAIKDTASLTNWHGRMVALGLAQRSDLLARVAGLSAEDTRALNEVCDAAKEAGGGSTGANLGTAIHDMTARMDLGLPVTVPEAWRPAIDSYYATLSAAGMTVVPGMVERVVAIEGLEEPIAGTFDRLYSVPGFDLPLVGDLKTGKSVEYGIGEFAMQLALYAHATFIHDPVTGEHTPMPAVDREHAIIAHIPAGTGTAALYLLDITPGLAMVELAIKVRAWRKASRKLLVPLSLPETQDATSVPADEPADEPAPDTDAVLTERQAWVKGRVKALVDAGHADALGACWPEGVATLRTDPSPGHEAVTAIAAACDEVEGRVRAPFTDPDPGRGPKVKHGPEAPPAEDPFEAFRRNDQAVPKGSARVAAVKQRIEALPDDLQLAITAAVKAVGAPRLDNGTATEGHVAYAERLTTQAEAEANERLALIAAHIGDLPASVDHRTLLACVLDAPGIDAEEATARMTDLHVELLGDLVDAIAAGVIDGDLSVEESRLSDAIGGKRQLVAEAKAVSEQVGRERPTKTADVTADPVLAASTWARHKAA